MNPIEYAYLQHLIKQAQQEAELQYLIKSANILRIPSLNPLHLSFFNKHPIAKMIAKNIIDNLILDEPIDDDVIMELVQKRTSISDSPYRRI